MSSHTNTGDTKQTLTVSRPPLLKESSDAVFRQMVHDLLAFTSRVETIRQDFGRHIGLSGIQYTILISIAHLQNQQGGIGIKSLAKHLTLSESFITIEVGKLVQAKLVEKTTNPKDRRGVLLSTNNKSDTMLASLSPVQCQVNDALFNTFNADEFNDFAHIIKRLLGDAERAAALSDYLINAHQQTQNSR